MSFRHFLYSGSLTFVLIAFGFAASARAQTQDSLPVVSSASVPFYPRTAEIAHISGEVLLRVTTDGTHVTSISIESGQGCSVPAPQKNVKTWQFEKHKPITFETTFHYNLVSGGCDADCNCDSPAHNTVLLNLPSDV